MTFLHRLEVHLVVRDILDFYWLKIQLVVFITVLIFFRLLNARGNHWWTLVLLDQKVLDIDLLLWINLRSPFLLDTHLPLNCCNLTLMMHCTQNASINILRVEFYLPLSKRDAGYTNRTLAAGDHVVELAGCLGLDLGLLHKVVLKPHLVQFQTVVVCFLKHL